MTSWKAETIQRDWQIHHLQDTIVGLEAEIERLQKALLRIVLDPEMSKDEMLEIARDVLETK